MPATTRIGPVWRNAHYGPTVPETEPMGPRTIVCVDCGGRCHLISHAPDEGFQPGDILAFRCEDCLDRWDIEITADDLE